MRRLGIWALCFTLITALSGCAAGAEERIGEAQGYGGVLRVAVTVENGAISGVQVTEHHETEGVGTKAIDALPQRIAAAQSAAVDVVSGATVTSRAIMAAVQDAMGEAASPGVSTGTDMAVPSAESTGGAASVQSATGGSAAGQTGSGALPADALTGCGMTAVGRLGPGSDDAGNPVYSFNVVFASGVFDPEGRVLHLSVDQLEVATPNYDGSTMPELSGFPGQGGWAKWDDAAGKTSGKTEDTEDAYLAEVAAWQSKRARGESYKLTTGTWEEQMNAYQRLFTGKTVDEIERWVQTYCSDVNGRPIKADSTAEGDGAKYAALSPDDQALLTDVTSSATMSLTDAHGDILGAIKNAWEDARKTR